MSDTGSPIEKLLQDRSQFVSWLTRLNSSGDGVTVPDAVRSKVRADYERRLESVLAELRSHTSSLESQVTNLTTKHRDLVRREGELKEQLSEAEVRHLVGEYDDHKWEGIRTDLMKVILQVREELGHTSREIDRLSDVLATIRTPVAPEPVAPPPPPAPSVATSGPRPSLGASGPRSAVVPEPPMPVEPEPAPAPEPEPIRPAAAAPPQATTEIPFRSATPRPAPAPKPAPPPKKEEVPGRTLWFPSGKPAEQGGGKLDELAFLKSVTGEPPQAPGASKSRPSGGFPKVPVPEPAPEPPAAPSQSPIAKVTAPPPGETVKDRQSGQKTLKCGECGTLNRPTEWYCERCGAELAAL